MPKQNARAFLVGFLSAAIASGAVTALWALSEPHHPWTHLLFGLFPEPVVDESVRLIALVVAFGAAQPARGAMGFALGFALLKAGVVLASPAFGDLVFTAVPFPILATALVAFVLHAALCFIGASLNARHAPMVMILSVLLLLHAGFSGALIALMR
jgi:hypothetical protein